MNPNQSHGRDRKISGGSAKVEKRGEGLNTGPVGKSDGYANRTGGATSSRSSGGVRTTRGSRWIVIAIVILVLLGGGGGGLSAILGGGSDYSNSGASSGVSGQHSASEIGTLLGFTGANGISTGWQNDLNNTGKLDRNVAPEAKDKRTEIIGDGTDRVTIMVYMCGTDLESRGGMATNDLKEMMDATLSENVDIVIYTGGCKDWKTIGISNHDNQIYHLGADGRLECLEVNDYNKSMTDPKTLSYFIKYAAKAYPANRNMLILWDHGGGSLTGYGYDEKHPESGSMDLSKLDQALSDAEVQFDFIGFDTCLMSTLETGLMTSKYADYMIASEETEPGIGWYYTEWLTALSANPSMPTIEIGKHIIDDFVRECNNKCPGQGTTLAIVDLCELSATVPEKLTAFSTTTGEMIKGSEYQKVSNARSGSREFAVSSKIDQIDLVHFANSIGTPEALELSDSLLSAIKYNKTSASMTNAYGISIYFPYKRASRVDNTVSLYNTIGMDDEYAKCIKAFAGMETSGQIAAGGEVSPLSVLLSSGSDSSVTSGADAISSLLSAFMGGGRTVEGFDREQTQYLTDKDSFDADSAAAYIAANQFDPSYLTWNAEENGDYTMSIPDEQWARIQSLQLNMFCDDGEGYIDLGLDNVYEFTKDGKLLADQTNSWLAIDGQPVAYYYESEVWDGHDYTITGRVPVLINGERANLILVFDNDHKYGYIAGARYDYVENETETSAKSEIALNDGDTIDFLCDYYGYDGSYLNTYKLGEQVTYREDLEISNVEVENKTKITYLLTDLYGQEYWTPVVP